MMYLDDAAKGALTVAYLSMYAVIDSYFRDFDL